MKEKDLENIVEDLLYEAAARKTLNATKSVQSPKRLILAVASIAAAIVIFLMAYSSFNDSRLFDQRNDLIAQHYEFPVVTKSRSLQKNIVDDYISELKNKDYKFVLSKLNTTPLSEEDSFVKAHLLFSLGSIDEAEKLISQTNWKDDYIRNEATWLRFLIAVKKSKSITTLSKIANEISGEHEKEAAQILEELNNK